MSYNPFDISLPETNMRGSKSSHSMNSFFDDVKNPRGNGQASAGGSSGGSAVAVATEQCIA